MWYVMVRICWAFARDTLYAVDDAHWLRNDESEAQRADPGEQGSEH